MLYICHEELRRHPSPCKAHPNLDWVVETKKLRGQIRNLTRLIVDVQMPWALSMQS